MGMGLIILSTDHGVAGRRVVSVKHITLQFEKSGAAPGVD
jgi:hypothetical protein